ncbi:hypothetical protein QUA13_31790 [Microcoleus sp. S28C3]|uniref:hypothetical protein n=1 Tax=Microcoleus sp. S28C3 TaxID=3055414 RepID=UPI002FCF3C6A
MKRFLRESWELWYWAMFCPSRLQQRMNEWAPAEENDGLRSDTHSWDILLWKPNSRFIGQFLLLIFLFSLPLMSGIVLHGQVLDLLLLFGAIVTAYSIGILCLSIGFYIPLLVYLIYPVNPQIYLIGLDMVQDILLPFFQGARGIFLGILALSISMGFGKWLANIERIFLARNVIAIGGTLSTWLGSWLATQNWYFALSVTGLIGLLLLISAYTIIDEAQIIDFTFIGLVVVFILILMLAMGIIRAAFVGSSMGIIMGGIVESIIGGIVGSTVVLVPIVGGFVGGSVGSIIGEIVGSIVGVVVGVVMGVVVGVVMGVVVGGIVAIVVGTIATLPLLFFLLICWIIAASISPTMQNTLAIITAITLTALGWHHHGWVSFLAVPVTLISYYRLADYLVLTLIDLLLAILLIKPFQQSPLRLLHLLPPYTTELVWVPLLNHDRILAAAFRTDASATLATFQKMQASPLPGLKVTIKEALPQIITNQLTVIENIYELIAIATPEHPFLPLLAPTFYQTESVEIDKQVIQTVSSSNNSLFRIWFIFTSALGSIITGVILIVSTQLIETIIGSIIAEVLNDRKRLLKLAEQCIIVDL